MHKKKPCFSVVVKHASHVIFLCNFSFRLQQWKSVPWLPFGTECPFYYQFNDTKFFLDFFPLITRMYFLYNGWRWNIPLLWIVSSLEWTPDFLIFTSLQFHRVFPRNYKDYRKQHSYLLLHFFFFLYVDTFLGLSLLVLNDLLFL